MVNGLLFAAACAAAARMPICMLSLDMTDEERAGCCLLARLIPKRSSDFSSLMKRTESPAKSLFVLTNTLQPVVSRCLFG